MKFKTKLLSLGLAAGGLILVTGCASTQTASQVLVCPECRIALEEVSKDQPEHDIYATREEWRHSCTGKCQGAMTTFFREGKWEHKCTVCAQGPYTCSLTHPTTEK